MGPLYFLALFFGCIAALGISEHYSRPKCKHCGSRDTRRGCYTRGYNEWCEQAAGDSGHYCMKCAQITWKQSFEDYSNSLPKWVNTNDCEWYRTGRKSTNGS